MTTIEVVSFVVEEFVLVERLAIHFIEFQEFFVRLVEFAL